MGGILGGRTNAKQQKAVGSLQFQTSQHGGVIPLVYGTTRLSGNLLDYDDFRATASSKTGGKGKGGGGGKGGGQQYTYSASFIMGLCQGPITSVGTVWWDKNISSLAALSGLSSINLGDDGQTGDPFWLTNHPAKALGYSGTANFTAANYQLGNTATLPNFSVEIQGIAAASGVNGFDASPAVVVADFLTNARYGAGFPSANLDPAMTTLEATSYLSYCFAAGLFVSPMLDTQQPAQQCLADIANLTNSAIVWSGGLLKVIPYGDQPLTASYQLVQLGGSVTNAGGDVVSLVFSHPELTGSPITLSYTTTGQEQTYAAVGAGLAQAVLGTASLTAFGLWASVSPDGVMIAMLNTAAQLTSVAVSASGGITAALGSTTGPYAYSPNTAPIYSLGEDDFIVQQSSVGINTGASPGGPALRAGATPVTGGFTDDPVHIVRSTPADANNYIQLQCKDRGNSYNSHVVETFDQAAVDLYGIRRDTSLKADMIVDPYLTGTVVAQLVLQRSLLFRNTYTFKLGWKYCLLEPMDLVQITDTRLGVSGLTVRITAVEEDDEGTLTITAEDFFGGYSTAVLYGKQSTAGYIPNWATGPGDINMPLIFEPPAALLSGDLEIWVALSGGPNWGGAQVWISSDGSSYGYAGTIPGPATQGVLTATLPSYGGSEPDTTNTLSVDLTESRGGLLSVSAGDAANLATLCYAGGELLAYQTATLTTTSHYGLTTLYRGAYGSTIGNHSSGAQFARLDQAIGRFPYPSTLIGQTIHLKFPSANIVGGGPQSLASVPAYTYTVTGSGKASVATTVSGSYAGPTTANLVVQRYVFAGTVMFPAGLTGSQGTAGVAATATTTYSIKKNGTNVGTMVFAAGATTASFTMPSATTFMAGDILTVVAPASPDATLANLAWTFVGSQ
jgi:hypothetical protein